MYTSVDFEISGRVQGVFFRVYTIDQAKRLGCVGWVMNTHLGTVKGVAQGPKPEIETLKQWLRYEGSPQSRIDEAKFSNEREIETLEYKDFSKQYPNR